VPLLQFIVFILSRENLYYDLEAMTRKIKSLFTDIIDEWRG